MTSAAAAAPDDADAAAAADVPIACSLDAASFQERAEEWRALAITSAEIVGTAVRLGLGQSDTDLITAVALAQREKECCPFFDVSVELQADRRTLVLAVPDGAEEVLDAFMALLRV
jgi:hypothetical protein